MKRRNIFSKDVLRTAAANCKEFLESRDTVYLWDVAMLLSKALDGVENKKDLTACDIDTIKYIRSLIQGL